MKTGARLPRGIRWLGLMALGGVSLAVQAEEKIVLLTSWYAQAEQGGIIRLRPPGCTKIRSRRRDPLRRTAGQRHAVAVVEAGRCDHRLRPAAAGRHSARLPGKGHCRALSVRSPGLLTHADVTSLQGLKDKTLLVSSSGQATWWPWLKAQYQLSDAQVRPYTFNIQPFVVDDAVAQQAYVSSEVFQVQKAGVKANFFLFSEHGYPPTAASLSPARTPSPSVKRRWRSLSAPQWRAG